MTEAAAPFALVNVTTAADAAKTKRKPVLAGFLYH
jgi:hypothetical protein